eukprot:m.1248163 g.1248163  ORF g.1248163 m.1248163 type:complete len:468 (-) comp24697_c0_seq11:451-1854(-)
MANAAAVAAFVRHLSDLDSTFNLLVEDAEVCGSNGDGSLDFFNTSPEKNVYAEYALSEVSPSRDVIEPVQSPLQDKIAPRDETSEVTTAQLAHRSTTGLIHCSAKSSGIRSESPYNPKRRKLKRTYARGISESCADPAHLSSTTNTRSRMGMVPIVSQHVNSKNVCNKCPNERTNGSKVSERPVHRRVSFGVLAAGLQVRIQATAEVEQVQDDFLVRDSEPTNCSDENDSIPINLACQSRKNFTLQGTSDTNMIDCSSKKKNRRANRRSTTPDAFLRRLKSSRLRENLGTSTRVYQRSRAKHLKVDASSILHEIHEASEGVPISGGILSLSETSSLDVDRVPGRSCDAVKKTITAVDLETAVTEQQMNATSKLKKLAEHFNTVDGEELQEGSPVKWVTLDPTETKQSDNDLTIRDKHPQLAHEYDQYRKMLTGCVGCADETCATNGPSPTLKQLLEHMPEHIEFACA